jgi:zinc transport system substrate-binding protein
VNNRKYILLTLVLITILLVSLILYSLNNTPNLESNEKIKVIVTLVPQVEFVERIGGDKVSVTVLVPPGGSPHTYEPTPSQMQKIAQANMYAKVGSGIEFELTWLDKILETNPNMLIVDCSFGIQLIDMTDPPKNDLMETNDYNHESVGKDPHIWLSPRNVVIMVENIYKGLVKLDKDNKDYYKKNEDSYIDALQRLDKRLNSTFSGLSVKKFLVYHPAWGYLAHDYGLEQIPIEEEGKAPTPAGLATLVDQAKENKIKVIFATPEFETKTAEMIANEIGGSVILISPLAEDYIENLNIISEEIVKSLQEI